MKKILYIVPEYPFGGAERQIMELAKLGFNNNFEVAILDIKAQKDRNIDDVRIYGLNSDILQKDKNKWSRNIYRIKVYFEIYNFVKNRNYDFICIFSHLFLPLILFRKLNIVFSVREFELKYFKGFYKKMIERTKIVTTNNLPSYIYLKNIHKYSFIINNIITDKIINRIEFVKNKEYLVISNIAKHKNILPVVQAFKFLEEEGYKLKIIGRISDDDYFKDLSVYFSENIKYLGFLDKKSLENEYKNASGVIHISLKEGTPNALLDAIKLGKPFLALDTPENMSLLQRYSDFLTNGYEVDILVDRIKNINLLIEAEDNETKKYLEFLQKAIEKNFSEKNGEYFYEILEKGLVKK